MVNIINTGLVVLGLVGMFGVGGVDSVVAKMATDHKILVFIDDSDTAYPQEKFEILKQDFMAALAELDEDFFYHTASVEVVSTSGQPLWSGTIADIQSKKGLPLKEAIASKPFRCNHIAGGFSKLDTMLQMLDGEQFTDVKIYWVSNFYATSRPCSRETKIVYPSPLPKNVDFVGILTQRPEVSAIGMYGVHPENMKGWGKALEALKEWEHQSAGRAFGIYADSQTSTALDGGLEGIATR
ncbi:MAG: hypothetical protein NPIRA03_25640 [Nitrospirales bacterium]|nr:MAG: hypothetical protein NPIRA03_25640 [Nitrospirales bacterium]